MAKLYASTGEGSAKSFGLQYASTNSIKSSLSAESRSAAEQQLAQTLERCRGNCYGRPLQARESGKKIPNCRALYHGRRINQCAAPHTGIFDLTTTDDGNNRNT